MTFLSIFLVGILISQISSSHFDLSFLAESPNVLIGLSVLALSIKFELTMIIAFTCSVNYLKLIFKEYSFLTPYFSVFTSYRI